MARHFIFSHPQPQTFFQAGLAVTTLLLFGFVMFMCASHSRRWRRFRACYDFNGHDPVIHLNNEGMMPNAGAYDPSAYPSLFSSEQTGVPIWQKNIVMGGKCQLPDFSGVIIYDSEGNVVTPAKNPTPLLTWK